MRPKKMILYVKWPPLASLVDLYSEHACTRSVNLGLTGSIDNHFPALIGLFRRNLTTEIATVKEPVKNHELENFDLVRSDWGELACEWIP